MRSKPIHPELTRRIRELMDTQNITNTAEMRNHLRAYVRDNFPESHPLDTAFSPTDHAISMAIQRHLGDKRHHMNDQADVIAKVAEWKKKWPNDLIYFRPRAASSNPEQIVDECNHETNDILYNLRNCLEISDTQLQDNMLFVYISKKQLHLWKRYGTKLVLMDATYRICRYAIPLFFLAVKTNVGFSSVGLFSCQAEDSRSIAEALTMVKLYLWKYGITVSNIMTDNSKAEIDACRAVFEGEF